MKKVLGLIFISAALVGCSVETGQRHVGFAQEICERRGGWTEIEAESSAVDGKEWVKVTCQDRTFFRAFVDFNRNNVNKNEH